MMISISPAVMEAEHPAVLPLSEVSVVEQESRLITALKVGLARARDIILLLAAAQAAVTAAQADLEVVGIVLAAAPMTTSQ